MTFFGERRAAEHAASNDHGHGHNGDGDHVHESPKVMLVPLMILAFLSIFGGLVGVPKALGGGNRFDQFLTPAMNPSAERASP